MSELATTTIALAAYAAKVSHRESLLKVVAIYISFIGIRTLLLAGVSHTGGEQVLPDRGSCSNGCNARAAEASAA